MSNGTFGAKIAEVFIRETDADMIFLRAKHSASPCRFEVDIRDPYSKSLGLLQNKMSFLESLNSKSRDDIELGHERYGEMEYVTFDEYRNAIHQIIPARNPNVIILAAAVSDYGTKPVEGKIRSDKDMTIELEPLKKVISEIRTSSPKSVLVGFKLLVGSTKTKLIEAAKESIEKNGCDLVVANDWRDIKVGNHKILIVGKNYCKECLPDTGDRLYQARKVKEDVYDAYEKMRVRLYGGM
jgi:hypothetical protein